MSVINKMLRDLDQRQMPTPLDGAVVQRPHPAQASSIPWAPPRPNTTAVWRVGCGILLLVMVGVGSWVAWQSREGDAPSVVPPLSGPVAITAAAPAPAASEPLAVPAPPLAAVSIPGTIEAATPVVHTSESVLPAPVEHKLPSPAVATQATPEPVRPGRMAESVTRSANPSVSLRMESSLSARKALDAVLSKPVTAPAVAPTAPPPASPKASAAPAVETLSAAQRQQQASADAVLQAQTLWNAGSHAAAMDLLQQSVDAAERAVKAGGNTVGNAALLSSVRELVRMQMAQSHFAAVWELLVRLEPVLGNQPDLWGLRGNTGQRLGRHQDSVSAYRTALQSRPDEPRWLLGCAVSLAALGQSAQAAEMVERARTVGPISRDVQIYLQQMGVPFKDK